MRIVVSVLLLLFVGCKAQETTVLDRKSASTHIERVLADSVALRDSIIIRETCDTVFFTKYRTLYKERLRVDTVIKCDTVYAERLVTLHDKENGRRWLWLLMLPLIAVMWKIGLFDLLRNLITKNIK